MTCLNYDETSYLEDFYEKQLQDIEDGLETLGYSKLDVIEIEGVKYFQCKLCGSKETVKVENTSNARYTWIHHKDECPFTILNRL